VVKAATVPLADSTKERRRFLVKVIQYNVKIYGQLIWLRIIQAEEILTKIKRGEPVEYENVVIEGDLNLNKVELPTGHVERTKFETEDLRLAEEARLVSSHIIITKSEILNAVNFRDIIFQDVVIFNGTKFRREANFVCARFKISPQFSYKAQFRGDANFYGGHFEGGADFIGAQFHEHANFIKTYFKSCAIFTKAEFNNSFVSFEEAEFDGGVLFISTHFIGDANFLKAKFNGTLNLKKARFDRLFVNWNDIKNCLECDITLYPTLIKNYNNISFFEDADNCYYKYRKINQSENRPFWSKRYDHIAWRSCGYGVRPSFTIAWILGLIPIFALFYWWRCGIARSASPEIAMKLLDKSTFLFTFAPGKEDALSFWECLYFSAMALTGRVPEGLHPIGAWKYAVMLESVLGYLFLALFIVVLARKMIR